MYECLSVIFKFSVINMWILYSKLKWNNSFFSKEDRDWGLDLCLLNVQGMWQIEIAPDIQYKSQTFITV